MDRPTTEAPLSALILAAGESKRMGDQNKLCLPIGAQTLIERVVEVVAASLADEVLVVLGHEASRIRDLLARCGVGFVENKSYRQGMTTSIQAGVRGSRSDTAGYMIVLADQPLLETSELNQLILAFRRSGAGRASIILPEHRGGRGNPVIFSAHYRDELLAHPEMEGCRALVARHEQDVVRVEMETDHVLRDMDRYADYQEIIGDENRQ